VVTGPLRICADKSFVPGQAGRAWVQQHKALQHLFHHVFRTINEFFHNAANVQR
jgi:hypothetical protein